MKTFFVLWIMLGFSKSQTLAIDHFETMAECQAAANQFVVEYNARQNYSWEMIEDDAANCFKVEVK